MSVTTLKEIESQVHPSTTRDYWEHISNRYGISITLACAIAQPPSGKTCLRLSAQKKDNLIMEIHNLQGTIKDIERLVPGCNKHYIRKVIEKNIPKEGNTLTDELVEFTPVSQEEEAKDEMKKVDKKMWIPRDVIEEAKKNDMPLYDFVSFLYESYKEEKIDTHVQIKEVEKVVEKEVIKEVQVPVKEKQVLLRSIVEDVQNQDSYPDMRKLRAAFEIISGIINRTLSLEKVKELGGGGALNECELVHWGKEVLQGV